MVACTSGIDRMRQAGATRKAPQLALPRRQRQVIPALCCRSSIPSRFTIAAANKNLAAMPGRSASGVTSYEKRSVAEFFPPQPGIAIGGIPLFAACRSMNRRDATMRNAIPEIKRNS
jgi:hypothetical protein